MTEFILHEKLRLAFRHLSVSDLPDVSRLEKACIKANEAVISRGYIHTRSDDEYARVLQPDSAIKFIGAFRHGSLVGFGGYTVPQDIQELRKYDVVSISRKLPFQDAALAQIHDQHTGMTLGLRVHPEHEGQGIGPALIKSRLSTAMGIGCDLKLHNPGRSAALMMTNVTSSNVRGLDVQFRSDVTHPVIWSAGFEMNHPEAPGNVFVLHVPLLNRANLEFVQFWNRSRALGDQHQAFAHKLADGHVAWLQCGTDPSFVVSKRPDWIKTETRPSSSIMALNSTL